MKSLLIIAIALLATSQLDAQQPLSLGQALERAQNAGYGNRIAAGQAEGERTRQLQALRGILPSLRFEAGYARTTDPIGAFGTTLRQRIISQADFDPRRLNFPAPVDNYAGAVVLEAPLLNADAHLGRLAATNAAAAASANAEWIQMATKADVIRAYFGAVLAAEKVATMETAISAARGHVRQAELMARNGMVTRSDVLMAQVKAGEIETALLEARGDLSLAKRGLAVLLGEPGADYQLPQTLPATPQVVAVLQSAAGPADVSDREDVVAAQQNSRAAQLDQARARSLYLPRINGMARYDWSSASRIYGGDSFWSLGIMATWTPFSGAAEIAEQRATNARATTAQAGLEAARAQAGLDVYRAAVQRDVALNRLDIAERSARQSAEAHRIITRKYEGGLATIVELLDGAAVETGARLGLSHARYLGIVAAADELKARGADPASLAAKLTQTTTGVEE